MYGRRLTIPELAALEAKEFLGPEFWNRMKEHGDDMLRFRKSLKGKPDETDLAIIKSNQALLRAYDHMLFHAHSLAVRGICPCNSCASKRNIKP